MISCILSFFPSYILRKMYVSGVADLPSNSLGVSDGSNAKLEEETEDPIQMAKIRCLCRSTLATDRMIKVHLYFNS